MLVGGDDSLPAIGIFTLFVVMFVFSLFMARRATSDRNIQFMRHRSFVGRVLAEAKGFNISLLGYLVVVLVVLAVAAMFSPSSWEDLVRIAIPMVVIAAVLIYPILSARITIEPGGISVGNPGAIIKQHYPFKRIEHVSITRRILTIRLDGASPWSKMARRLYVREDGDMLASVLRRTMPSSKLSVAFPIPPAGARIPTVECPECGEKYDSTEAACPKCGTVIPSTGYMFIGNERDLYPIYAGVALMASSIFLVITGVAFLNMEGLFADIYGRGPGVFEFCGWIEFIFAIIAFAGGVASLAREHYSAARAGAIVSIIGGGGLVSVVLGIAAFLWLRKSSHEFRDQ